MASDWHRASSRAARSQVTAICHLHCAALCTCGCTTQSPSTPHSPLSAMSRGAAASSSSFARAVSRTRTAPPVCNPLARQRFSAPAHNAREVRLVSCVLCGGSRFCRPFGAFQPHAPWHTSSPPPLSPPFRSSPAHAVAPSGRLAPNNALQHATGIIGGCAFPENQMRSTQGRFRLIPPRMGSTCEL
jgi:hypothetical protein